MQKPLFNSGAKIESTAVGGTSSDDTEKLLENLTVCKPAAANNTDNAGEWMSHNSAPNSFSYLLSHRFSAPSGGNIFSMSSFTTPTKTENVSSIFGGNAAAKSPFSNFGNVSTPSTTTTQPSVFASSFSSPNVTVSTAPANTPSGIFGKPEQSAFGQQPKSIFGGAATTQSSNVFGGAAAATPSSNVFGGNAFETPSSTTTTTSTFGANQNAFGTPTSNAFGATTGTPTSNAFGGTTTFGTPTTSAFGSSTTTSNIFGNSAGSGFGSAGNAFSSTKSIFGGGGVAPDQTPAFGSTGGSLFGASNATPTSPFGQTASQSTGSLFGGSSFGGGAQPSTGSIFGGASTGSTGFGQSTFGGSSFSQQSSPFASNTAGAFSQSPQAAAPGGFGGNPTFGGQPTFGSPKSGFGSFANVATGFGTSPTQQNSLFESLGSSDTGLSFGNIAQNSNASAPKSSFGGG